MYLQGLGRGTFQELPSLELETGDAIKSLSLNRSYCIAVLHAGKVVEWGMGICRERDSSPMSVPGSDESTSNINSLKNSNVTVGRKGSQIERDVDIARQFPVRPIRAHHRVTARICRVPQSHMIQY